MNETKVFRDPIYGYIKIEDEIIWKLVQTKEFQRLRRIHQLGGTSMVFHTAEHSRFSHSLGVYEIARRIVYEVDGIRKTLTKEERLITLCAALLHDLGHGPYSHAFEGVFNTNHERYTIDIINGVTEVNHVLESLKPGLADKVSRLIEHKCYRKNCVSENCNHGIMINIVSSQLDADRLDYLQRDAYNTGASYGEIDQDRILRSIMVVNNQLAYKFSSMHAIESYLMSRYHMYWQVYYHPVSVSYEVLLTKIFKRVKDLLKDGYTFEMDLGIITKLFSKQISLNDYLELDEGYINFYIKLWMKEKDSILRDLSTRFMNRRLFKYLTCDSSEDLEKIYHMFNSIYKKYGFEEYYLHKDTITKEAYQYYNEKVMYNSPILLYHKNQLIEIAELSHIVKGIKDIGAKKDYKLYFARELIEQMDELDKKELETFLNLQE